VRRSRRYGRWHRRGPHLQRRLNSAVYCRSLIYLFALVEAGTVTVIAKVNVTALVVDNTVRGSVEVRAVVTLPRARAHA
jgi:hypothetical protein